MMLWSERAGCYIPAPETAPTVGELEWLLSWCKTDPERFGGAIIDLERELARRTAPGATG